VDVQNPLLGPKGATRIYGPQKGLKAADFELAERCLGRLAGMVLAMQQKPATTERRGQNARKHDFSRAQGAGAAGGLGFGLAAFLGAELQPGFELFARRAGLERRLSRTDLVVTGEGTIDDSTLMGKGVGQIARRCRELKIPCIGLGGADKANLRASRLFSEVHALTELATVGEAKVRAGFWLERLAARVSESWVEVSQ